MCGKRSSAREQCCSCCSTVCLQGASDRDLTLARTNSEGGLATQHSREDDQGPTVTKKRNDQREVVFIDEIPYRELVSAERHESV